MLSVVRGVREQPEEAMLADGPSSGLVDPP